MPSGNVKKVLPFSAVMGMEDVKRALECASVDGTIGVLIKGPSGTAKSVLVRSFGDLLPGKKITNIPQNVTDEQLFGGLDVEEAIISGRTVMKNGTLQRADGNILYLDNINLFDTRILGSIMECVGTEKVRVEREGLSAVYDLRTTPIATMDPAEQALPDSIADRFDICVQSYPITDENERSILISRNLEFDADPEGSAERYSEENERTAMRTERAKSILKDVVITRMDVHKISMICSDLGVKGHRADISTAKVSKVLAALAGRYAVSDKDIREAAVLCLLHRRGEAAKENARTDENPPEKEEEKKEIPDPENTEKKKRRKMKAQSVITQAVSVPQTEDAGHADAQYAEGDFLDTSESGTVAEITGSVKEILSDLDRIEAVRLHRIAGESGRRRNIAAKKRTGRSRGSRIPDGKTTDPAFDATIRAAAPYQRTRGERGLSVNIEKQDIREKIRMKRDSCSFLFAVDVSGSLVDSGMMNDIKNGVKAMLMDGYVRRDKVALMTFRTGEVKISVPFTRSVEGICDSLDGTETGGGTPLGAALLMIRQYLLNYLRKNTDERCFVILMTDGETTDPVIRGEPTRELKRIASTMRIPNTGWVVVDSSLYIGKINHALRLSEMLGARYIRLEDLRSA